jgi:hypothetical protein
MKKCNIGLFLGAGASCELGMPLVTEVTTEFKNYFIPKIHSLNEGWKKQGGGYHQEVINQTITLLNDQELNYENILGYLQTRAQQHNNPMASQYRSLYIKMLETLYFQLYLHQIKCAPSLKQNLSSFEGLSNFSRDTDILWVFSLNHDIMFELIGEHIGLTIHDAFWPKNIIEIPLKNSTHVLYADTLTEEELNSGQINILNKVDDKGINLLKLHGSLDVFTYQDGLNLCRIRPVDNNVTGRIASLRLINEFVGFSDEAGDFLVTNEIVYADKQNTPQFLRRTLLSGAQKFNPKYEQTLPKKMLDIFKSYINYVSHMYVVGYSFGDLHIDFIIKNWLEFSHERLLTIVSPSAKIPYHFLHLKPQISIVPKRASEFFQEYK